MEIGVCVKFSPNVSDRSGSPSPPFVIFRWTDPRTFNLKQLQILRHRFTPQDSDITGQSCEVVPYYLLYLLVPRLFHPSLLPIPSLSSGRCRRTRTIL